MATIEDVRALALALPGVEERVGGHTGEPAWRCHGGQIAWVRSPRQTDLAQLAELGRSWPHGTVLAVRTESVALAGGLVASDPAIFFTIPHFAGYPAVLLRLDAIGRDHLGELIADAWLLRAPKTVARTWLDERGLD
ncbi:MmcQ/YjbR family DNA-binding protein [Microbacterium sp. 22242]|uniref:MmcQ/YjbR family DNA-binding protein n=1 Tax=Microbacterium sp. 22242 TaxID=3453896 RepID=UPI003F877C92